MGHLNIGPVYRVGQIEIEHSSKTSLFQETEGEIYRESETLDPLWYCVFRASRGFTSPGLCSGLTGGSQHPQTPAELSNRYLTQMRIGGQRTVFEIHHCTKMQGFIVVSCSFWGELELNLNIICLRFITNIINYVTGLAETKNVHKTSLSLKIDRQNKLSHVAKKWRKIQPRSFNMNRPVKSSDLAERLPVWNLILLPS